MAAGYKASDVLKRVQLARVDAAKLQAAANLTGTLLARVNALKATATPEEVAQLDAEVPVLQRGQKDLQAGINHLNSYATQAEQVVQDTQEGVEAVGGGANDVGLPGGIPAGALGSPEHKAAKWAESQASNPGGWNYDRWSKVYDLNMTRTSTANAAADAYGQTLGWGWPRQRVDIKGEVRVLDWADIATKRGIEYKTGYIYRTPEIDYELKRDALLVQQDWDISWVFEGTASKPLQDALAAAGIKVVFFNNQSRENKWASILLYPDLLENTSLCKLDIRL